MKLSFNARELKAFADENGHDAHNLSTTLEQLALIQQRYASIYAIFNSLWMGVEDGSGEVTVRTLTTEVKLMIDGDMLFKLANLLAPELEGQLSALQGRILNLGAQYEQGEQAFQHDATDEQIDIKRALSRDFATDAEVIAA